MIDGQLPILGLGFHFQQLCDCFLLVLADPSRCFLDLIGLLPQLLVESLGAFKLLVLFQFFIVQLLNVSQLQREELQFADLEL